MHPYITEALAAQHRDDLLRAARRHRIIPDREGHPTLRLWKRGLTVAGRILRPAGISNARTPQSPAAGGAGDPGRDPVVDLTEPAPAASSPIWPGAYAGSSPVP